MPENKSERSSNNWSQYQKLVMTALQRHDEQCGKLLEMMTSIKVEVAMLKVKAGVWGMLAGLIPGVIVLIITLLRK